MNPGLIQEHVGLNIQAIHTLPIFDVDPVGNKHGRDVVRLVVANYATTQAVALFYRFKGATFVHTSELPIFGVCVPPFVSPTCGFVLLDITTTPYVKDCTHVVFAGTTLRTPTSAPNIDFFLHTKRILCT